MREQLIRYLLGELDADERRDLQSQLRNDPELRAELEHLKSCIASSRDEDLFAPDAPTGLASRTAGMVSSGELPALKSRQGDDTSHAGEGPAGFLGWNLADLTVAGGVMLAVSMLIFPALRNSRDGTRRNVCGDHQRQMYVLVASYAQDHGGDFPKVASRENAGVYTTKLIGNGYAGAKELAVLLVCPGAPLADKVRSGELVLKLPDAEEIRALSAEDLAAKTAGASPFFNYRLPYVANNKLCAIRNDPRVLTPILSDASGDERDGPMSPNHGGRVAQVLFANGSVGLLTSVRLPGSDDDMYHNRLGKVAAGRGPDDAVLGPSDAMPGVEEPAADGR